MAFRLTHCRHASLKLYTWKHGLVFMDLNISYTTDKKRLQNVIATAATLGYSTVAINYVVDLQQKKQGIGNPKCVSELYDTFPVVQGKSRTIKVFNRLPVVASEHHTLPTAEYKAYDLVAVYPKTEAACMTFDVDIICVAVTEKQPFFFKRSPVNGNVIVTSGAEKPLELRGPYDIGNLGLLFGLSEGDGKSAISTNCRSVHLHGEPRKTALGIVHTMKKDQPLTERQEDVSASKRAKIETA
uniref:Ribonuclease P/MRP 30 subunit n=1 Tax=Salmo trutta TaxID=8032 RepID=A0A673ZUX7_SALTR